MKSIKIVFSLLLMLCVLTISLTASADVVDIAIQQLDEPYVYGHEGPDSFDCSGLMLYCYGKVGITLNRVSYEQATNGTFVVQAELARGDLVFFETDDERPGDITHVGMYEGNNIFIHASYLEGSPEYCVVRRDNLENTYWSPRYVTARRIYDVGHFADGWNTDGSSQAIKECFDLHGGRDGPGYAFSDAGNPIYVHEWGDTGLLVQNFINANGEESCIIYDPDTDTAVWIRGGFWEMYRWNDGPNTYGMPFCEEADWYGIGPDGEARLWTRQDFSQITLLWHDEVGEVLFMATPNDGFCDSLAYEGTVTIALSPTLTLNPLDAHRIEVLWPNAMNRAYVDVYCEDEFVSRVYETSYIIDGLEPSTTYHIKIMVYGADGEFLQELGPLPATTKAEEVTGIESIDISVSVGTGYAFIRGAPVQDAVLYEYLKNGQVEITSAEFNAYIWGLNPGTIYQFQVKAYNASGMLVGQSNTVSATAGAVVSMYFTDAPTVIRPDSTYSAVLYIDNPTSYPITNVTFSDVYVNQDTGWFALPEDLGSIYVAPYSSKDISITFSTLDGWPVAEKIALNAYFWANCQMGNLTSIDRSAYAWMRVASFMDLVSGLRLDTQTIRATDELIAHIGCSNQSNTQTPETSFHLYLLVDGVWQLIADLTVPTLQPLETWQVDITLPAMVAGTYQLEAVVDPNNLISESDETDNSVEIEFEVLDESVNELELLQQALDEGMLLEMLFDGSAGSLQKIESSYAAGEYVITGHGPLQSTDGYDGTPNGTMRFNGDWSYVKIEYSPELNPKQILIHLEIRIRDVGGYQSVGGNTDIDNRNVGWTFFETPEGQKLSWGTAYGTENPMSDLDSNTIFEPEQWYDVWLIHDQTGRKIVINGKLDAQDDASYDLPKNNTPWYFGKCVWAGESYYPLYADLDDLAIYSATVRVEDLEKLYSQPVAAAEQAVAEEPASTPTAGVPEYLRWSLIADWAFNGPIDSLEKTLNSDSKYPLNINLMGGVESVPGADGTLDGAIRFHGSYSEYGWVQDHPALTQYRTLEMLVKPRDVSRTQSICGKAEAGDRSMATGLGGGSYTGKFQYHTTFGVDAPLTALNSNRNFVAGEWVHILCVMSDTGRQIYINGVLDSSDGTFHNMPDSYVAMYIAIGVWEGTFYYPWDGEMDFLRLYEFPLTSEDAKALAESCGQYGK